MSKTGYKCHTWTDDENDLIRLHYVTKTNEQIAAIINLSDYGKKNNLNRTPDAVRKQLNKLELHRVRKAEIKILQKKVGKTDFWGQIQKGRVVRKKHQAEQERQVKRQQEIKKETKFAADFLGEDYKEKPIAPPTEETIWLHLDAKTHVKIPKSKAEAYIKQWKKQQIKTQ